MTKLVTKFISSAAALMLLSACNTAGKAIESASAKTLVGDGWIALNKVTITDSTTNSYTPQIFSLFMTGRYVSLLKGAQTIYYDKKESAATFNSSAKTTEEYLIIQIKDNGDMQAVLAELAKFKQDSANTTPASEQTGATSEVKTDEKTE